MQNNTTFLKAFILHKYMKGFATEFNIKDIKRISDKWPRSSNISNGRVITNGPTNITLVKIITVMVTVEALNALELSVDWV